MGNPIPWNFLFVLADIVESEHFGSIMKPLKKIMLFSNNPLPGLGDITLGELILKSK